MCDLARLIAPPPKLVEPVGRHSTLGVADLNLQPGYVENLTVSENRQVFSNIQATTLQAQGDLGNLCVNTFKQKSFIGDINHL